MTPKTLFIRTLLPLFLIGCGSNALDLDQSPMDGRGFVAADFAQIYFTNPGEAPSDEEDTALDDALIALIDGAKRTIDIAIYELDDAHIIAALIRAHQRGVSVRMVGDADEASDEGYLELVDHGIGQQLRYTSGIMHNKFAVVDQRVVWTGSTNLTFNGLNRNNNNAILLNSEKLSVEFTAEFEQMYGNEDYGAAKEDANSSNEVPFNDGALEFYFAPQHEPVEVMEDLIDEADHSALFMVFSFTHPNLSDALIHAKERGVDVAGILDESQSKPWYSKDEVLAEANVPVFLDGNKNASGWSGGKLHHKVLIVDAGTDSNPFVVTGSFNWSKNADTRNDENLIVLRDPAIVDQYFEEYCRLLEIAQPHPSYSGPGSKACLLSEVDVERSVSGTGDNPEL